MTDKLQIFDNATQRILATMDTLGLDAAARNLVLQLRHSMTLPAVRMTMVPSFHQMNFYPAQGFCEPASLALADKMGPDWDLMEIKGRDWTGGPHFFVQHRPSGRVLDITSDQYAVRGIRVPYNLGRAVKIDRRRQKVLDKYLAIMGSLERND